MFCDALFLGLLAVIKMARMNLLLTLFSLIPMAMLMASGAIVGRYMMKKWDYRQKVTADLSDFAQESFSGIAVIKAFVKETKELMAFRRLNRKNEDANVDYVKASTLLNITVTAFVESVICIILGYGGWLVHEGVFNAGQLVEFIGYFTAIVWPIMAVSQLIEMQSRGKASLGRITELLDTKPEMVDKPDVEDVPELRGGIEFRDLTFRYPGGEFDVLKNVSFTIKPGENVGIIGRTGSGKTTLVDPASADLQRSGRHDIPRRTRHQLTADKDGQEIRRVCPAGQLPLQRHNREQHLLRDRRRKLPGD